MSNKEIEKYDDNGNLIYFKCPDGYELWEEYDKNNKLIHYKNTSGLEWWAKYDELKNKIEITEQEYKEIEFRKNGKKYNSRTKCSRFELMDI